MRKVNMIFYALIGLVAVLFGVGALFFPTSLESEAAQSSELKHVLREHGATAVFLGLMAFWCIPHYGQRRVVHYFLMLFSLLLAGIHWVDFFNGSRPLMSGLVNSVPFLVLSAMAAPLLRAGRTDE